MSDLKAQARELAAAMEGQERKVSELWTSFKTKRDEAQAAGNLTPDTINELDRMGRDYDSARDELNGMREAHAKLVNLARLDGPGDAQLPGTAHPEGRKSGEREAKGVDVGERFIGSDVYAQLKASGKLSHADLPLGVTDGIKVMDRAELKTTLETGAGAAALWRADRTGLLVPAITAPLNLLDVIPVGTTDSDSVEWVEETTYTNAAAETAETVAAPESAVAYTVRSSTVQEVTHFIPTTKKVLADAGQASSLINNALTRGVRLRLQSQIVNGNGTSPNLRGLLNVAGINTQARGTDSRVDAVHKAMTSIRINGQVDAEPDVIALHPTDYETIMLEKNAQGAYYYGGPATAGAGTVWGLAPIVTTAVAQGTPIVFDTGVTQLWVREGLSVSMSDSHSTYFTQRMVAVLAAMRAAFAVTQPKGVCTVTSF
jgi:HK97 family phage major capsid protein